MDNNKQEQINRLQDNLSAIRKIVGWTAEELGERIGVTNTQLKPHEAEVRALCTIDLSWISS